jgi:hypothetical protein
MSGVIAWIAAEAERPERNGAVNELKSRREQRREQDRRDEDQRDDDLREADLTQSLPAHQFPASPIETGGSQTGEELQPEAIEDPEEERRRRIYRRRTTAMLRRYMRHSIETGRLPSLLGKEFFRAKVTAYTVVTFEDRVIFVHDMEKCLERLDEFSRQLIARHILQEHDQVETARLLGCGERTVRRFIPLALDQMTEILLDMGMMQRLDEGDKNSCQGGLEHEISVSDCEDGENKF